MMFATNSSYNSLVKDYHSQIGNFQKSMKRLSTGSKLLIGDSPANLGISERFRLQVRNGKEASNVIQNATNLLQSSDAWLQEVQNILGRMNELALSSVDGSKSQEDRANIDLEFQQLKSEIGRISESGKYNGLQINGKTAVAVWDSVEKKIMYSQGDGSDLRTLDVDLQHGTLATTGESLNFESSENGFVGDFIFADDGESLLYIAQDDDSSNGVSEQKTIMKLDIESKSILKVDLASAGGTTANTQIRLKKDGDGRIWVSNPTGSGSTASGRSFNLNLLNTSDMSLDAGGASATNQWAGGVVLASGFSEFTISGDYCYYIENNSGTYRYVKQNIYDKVDKEVLMTDISEKGLNQGESYTMSADGQYIAFKDVSGGEVDNLVIVNTKSEESTSLSVGSNINSIVGLGFDLNNNLYWTNTGGADRRNEIKRLSITAGDTPSAYDIKTIRTDVAGKFGAATSAIASTNGMGLSITDGAPASKYQFQVGPEEDMSIEVASADVRLAMLGISGLDVLTYENASASISKLTAAVDKVSKQRAMIGSQVSRLNYIHSANESFIENLESAENRIRDVDIAEESSKLTENQIQAQASSMIIAQSKSFRESIIQFLQ